MEKEVNQAILLCKSVINQAFYPKNAKLADNIAIYGITVLTKKALLQIPLKKNTSILLNIDIPCSPNVSYIHV